MNKYLISVAIFAAGAISAATLMPTKIQTKIETKVVEKEVERKVAVKVTKTTKPNGEIVEVKTIDSDTSSHERTDESKYSKTITNPKKLLVYVGLNPLKPAERDFIAGFSYTVTGPFEVGAQYRNVGHIGFVTVGIRF